MTPLVEDHSEPEPDCAQGWCCGCPVHPIGKPWGWNALAWNEHEFVCKAAGNRP